MRRSGVLRRLGKLQIRWKLTLGSACMLLLIFAFYHLAQYLAIEQTMTSRIEQSVRESMDTVLNHILEREMGFEEADLPVLRQTLHRLNERNQQIRILDQDGLEIAYVTDGIGEPLIQHVTAVLPELSIQSSGDAKFMVLRAPLVVLAFQGTVEIVRGMEETTLVINRMGQVMLYTGLGAVLLSALGGAWLSGLLLRPLRSMAGTIRRVREDGWQARMPVSGSRDEMDTLMRMFNEMMDDVERSFNRQRRFTQDASHELRTPIAIVQGHLDMLRRWGADDPQVLKESLQATSEEMNRLSRLVEDLLALTRAEQQPSRPEEQGLDDAGKVLEALAANVRYVHPHHPLSLMAEELAGVPLTLSVEHLEQLLIIVVDNAARYSEEGRPIRISCRLTESVAHIEVSDEGIGIAEKDLPHVFDRFYRADKARSGDNRGTGLGLSIARRLVEQAGGSIRLHSTEHMGTVVHLELPVQSITANHNKGGTFDA
ncbi:sensor histidine kinase [Paenibacillus daejeonensis]|uniref:sensor histidine kinase n=1 Tax=Paenibacillus daejeonensis TaxID=135193 RepID=UPI000375FB1F|nr:HAMP domain-containing histidine kinase [Paenibacillus daejeonensis]